MRNHKALIKQIQNEGNNKVFYCEINTLQSVKVGQYFNIWHESESVILPRITYFGGMSSEGYFYFDNMADNWQPGDEINLWGPLGRGFSLPMSIKRLAVVVPDGKIFRIRHLIKTAIEHNSEVTLFINTNERLLIHDLSVTVEIRVLSDMANIFNWAEFLVMDILKEDLETVIDLLVTKNVKKEKLCPGQVLVRTLMPCMGRGDCYVCAFDTPMGKKFPCKEGPVFDLQELCGVVK